MKIAIRFCSSALLTLGVLLFAWVAYDATAVQQALGLLNRVDEAAVALLSVSMGALLVSLGIYFWRHSSEAAQRTTTSLPAA